MTAVAEEAQRRFRAEIDAALAEAPAGDPLARFRRLGLAYLRWAMRNPAHFEIISSGRYFDHDKAAELSRDNAELIGMTERTLAEAFAQGQLRSRRPETGADRRPRLGLRFRPHEHRRAFSALGHRGGGGRAHRRGDPRSLHRGDRRATPGMRGLPFLWPDRARANGVAGFCCACMTVPLHFYDTSQAPAAPCVSWSSPAKAKGRAGLQLRPSPWRPAKSRSLRYRRRRPALPRSASGGCSRSRRRIWRRWP